MKHATKLWLFLAAIFVFVLSATLVSCEKEDFAPADSSITDAQPLLDTLVNWRCCHDPDEENYPDSGGVTKNDKTESE